MNEYFRGLILGFSIAAPVGPIGLLCIRRSLTEGRLSGFLSGLGAATADAFYGSIAAFGLVAISSLLIQQQVLLRLVGGLFLVYLGFKAFFSRPPQQADQTRFAGLNKNLSGAYLTTFILTLTNPMTILSFLAIFAGLGFGMQQPGKDQIAWQPAARLVAGVFSGSALWWFLLSQVAGWFRTRLMGSGLVWVNRLSGMLIVVFGIWALSGIQSKPQNLSSTIETSPAIATPASTGGFAVAEQGQPLVFPRDFGAHPDFQTEWWYYTGNLSSGDGSQFGYQLTFFRRALIPPAERQERLSAWATDQAYLAHFALTDASHDQHYSFERLERGAAGIAGAESEPFQVWLEDWQVEQTGEKTFLLMASVPAGGDKPAIKLELTLTDDKGPVLQGDQGYSRKGPQEGNASYYYSLTRLKTDGTLQIDNRNYSVDGLSWMDHEYSTSYLSKDQVGWDWFSVQLDNNYELMLFQIRRSDGTIDSFSTGALVAPDGSVHKLGKDDFSIKVTGTWQSPHSGANYPANWEISIPAYQVLLDLQPLVADQEMDLRYKYWEGAVRIRGNFGITAVNGAGYAELTGYAGSMGGEF
jgi:predicted secreted hydrolase